MRLATIVDWGAIWQTVWTAAVAGVGVTVIASLGVLGAARAGDARRVGNRTLAGLYGALALAGSALTLAAAAWGITLIASK